MTGWIDTDLQGLRSNSSLSKVITELAQNALDTEATEITIEIAPNGRGLGRVVVTDNDPNGYINLHDAYTLFAPSTKAGDDRKRGLFNMGEKEFLAFAVEGRISTMSGTVTFNRDGTRGRSTRVKTTVGSSHTFTLRMTQLEQGEMIAALREIVLDGSQQVTVNGVALLPRPALYETGVALPLFVAEADDPYKFVTRSRLTYITLHEPASMGPRLHVLGMPVQPIDCPYSINVLGRLKMDHAHDQVAAPTVATILAVATNVLAASDKLTEDDAKGWAGTTLGKHSTPVAVKAVLDGRFGADAVVASPTDRGANADAASAGRTVIYGGSLQPEAWDAIKRARVSEPDLAPPSTRDFGAGVEGMLDNVIPEHMWTTDAARVVRFAKAAHNICLPDDGDLDVLICGGDSAKHCVAAATRGQMIFNQGAVGWEWFSPGNDVEILSTIVHELGHCMAHQAEHTYAWGDACSYIAARLLVCHMDLGSL